MTDAVSRTSQALMQAVAASGAVTETNLDFAVQVMRRELKSFLFDDKWADERAVALAGNCRLAMASLVADCVAQIAAYR